MALLLWDALGCRRNQYVVNTRVHEMYDKFTMTFNEDGVLQTWRAWCQG